MNPLKPSEIIGTWGTLLLPLNSDDSIDFRRLQDEITAIATAGVNGIYSNGTAGEFYAQTEAEFDRISQVMAEVCATRGLAFQIGVCHMSAQISLERMRRTVPLKPGAFQVVLPDWVSPTLEETIAFLSRMGEMAGPIGLVVYNPGHAKRVLSPAEWLKIADKVPSVVGVKVPGGDALWYKEMDPLLRRWSVFVPGHTLASGHAKGAAGSYSNVACLSPRGAQRWYALMKSDPIQALEWEQRIQGFIKTHIVPYITEQKYSNSAIDKLLAAIGGWAEVGTRLRWPYRWIPESEVARLREIAMQDVPELIE
jgi:4-hydroxy-tetrahydrodipicolinate synthase